jgi:predicted PurR-regulated permease PerM
MYILLSLSIWYYVIDANNQIRELYNEDYYKQYTNTVSNNFQLDLDELNSIGSNSPKVIDLNNTLPGVLFRLFWDLVGIMFSLTVVVILWVCENFKANE